MTYTRAQLESTLARRRGRWMSEVGMDSETVTGKNADLNDPLGWGIRQCGGSVSNIASVSDADVQTVSTADIDQLLDYAELKLLENILGNYEGVDVSGLPMSQGGDQFGKRVTKAIEDKRAYIEKQYPSDATGYTSGTSALTRVDGYSDDIAYDEV